ncbi:MAG: undecaprenyl/decaprenyl-phosphate alpha-N-acetylglucosaminyl 1-phosphate transferase, partial [Sulfurovum sp.]|nr:undecaprenyl/decaprenyl-phosphate alpha-N-acetylglucosaminyl 1-phosphate transferase [Sulfurovum sp.]
MNFISLYSFVISLLSLILIILLSRKYQFFLDPEHSTKPQHFHTSTTSRGGGIGIFLGIILLLFSPLGVQLMLPLLLAFLSGILEDYHNTLSPHFRLILQVFAAISAIWLTHSVVTYLGLGINMPYWLGMLFSAFAIVGMMNAINIIDGFNGLAAGVIFFILLSFDITAHQNNSSEMVQIIEIIMGAILGFMVLNFPKGKIFLGDGGAYLLGFIVSIIGIFLASRYESVSPWYILTVFIYPVWEVIFSIIRKLSLGLSPLKPDNKHLHMLIYRQLTKNNPLTALFIVMST